LRVCSRMKRSGVMRSVHREHTSKTMASDTESPKQRKRRDLVSPSLRQTPFNYFEYIDRFTISAIYLLNLLALATDHREWLH
jgi:hypothetical protein